MTDVHSRPGQDPAGKGGVPNEKKTIRGWKPRCSGQMSGILQGPPIGASIRLGKALPFERRQEQLVSIPSTFHLLTLLLIFR